MFLSSVRPAETDIQKMFKESKTFDDFYISLAASYNGAKLTMCEYIIFRV